MFEQVTDYKSACAVLGKKPIDKRRKLDEHIVLHIMLSTITEAINFIANGNKPWIPVYQQNKPIETQIKFSYLLTIKTFIKKWKMNYKILQEEEAQQQPGVQQQP